MVRPTRGWSFVFIRWPLLLLIGLVLILELIGYLSIRFFVYVWEGSDWIRKISKRSYEIRKAKAQLSQCKTYEEYKQHALHLDEVIGNNQWKKNEDSELYDSQLILETTRKLAVSMQNDDVSTLVSLLKACSKNNLAGIENEDLYSQSFDGTKLIIEDFYDTIYSAIDYISTTNLLTRVQKTEILKHSLRHYGKTALCLSGGAGLAWYHIGVVRCLLDLGLLPRIFTGTSGGSFIAAFCCVRTDSELKETLNSDMLEHLISPVDNIFKMIWRYFTKGHLLNMENFIETINWACNGSNVTFLEAYQRTGRILNITTNPVEGKQPPVLLNYKTAPNVTISSAVICSSSLPALLAHAQLLEKTPSGILHPFHSIGKKGWRDGSFRTDIPIKTLHMHFRVHFTIASQVNPHIVLFFFHQKGSAGEPSSHLLGKGWRGGFVFSTLENYLKLDMLKWIRLVRNLELTPTLFGQDLSKIFLQTFHGNVTIHPSVSLNDWLTLLSKPSKKEFSQKIERGKQLTWPKISILSNRMRIEQHLEKQLQFFSMQSTD